MSTSLRAAMLAFLLLGFSGTLPGISHAGEDWSKLDPGKRTKLELYMTPQQAQDYKIANSSKTLFLDVRSPVELMFLGTPTIVDANVPLKFTDTTKWDDKKSQYAMYENKHFVAAVDAWMKKKGLSKGDAIIMICRSGSRSAHGVNLLAAEGYTRVFNQVEGFEGDKAKAGPTKGQRTVNGWKNAGLPWTYELKKEVMYLSQ